MAAFVQQGANADTFGGSSIAPSITGTTAQNILFLPVLWSTTGFTAPSTPAGWSSAGPSQIVTCHANGGFGTGCSLFYKENIPGGSINPTVSFGAATVAAHGFIVEFSGALLSSSLDKFNGGANVTNGTSGNSGTTGTLAQSVEIVIALMAGPQVGASSNVGINSPATGGFTALDVSQNNSTNAVGQVSYAITVANTALTAGWTWTTSGEMTAIIATFQTQVISPVGTLSAPRSQYPIKGPLNQNSFRQLPQAFINAKSTNLTGQSATFSAGTALPSISVPLLGQTATFTAGTVSANQSGTVSLTGSTATFTPGILTPVPSFALSGQSASFSPGTLSVNVSAALTAAGATFAPGTVIATHDLLLTGQVGTFTTGTLGVTEMSNVALTGQTATFHAGILTPSGGTPVVGTTVYEVEFIANVGQLLSRG